MSRAILDAKQDKLLRDGRRALKLAAGGMSGADILLMVGSSRARLYRAMNAAALAAQDIANDSAAAAAPHSHRNGRKDDLLL